MTARGRRMIASLVAGSLLVAACGLDDGARVRNQDNVRDDSSIDE